MTWIKTLFLCLFLNLSAAFGQEAPVALTLSKPHLDDGQIYVGLKITATDGWQVYAPAPLGSETTQGFEPQIDFRNSLNIESLTPHWPAPIVKNVNEKTSYIYKKNTLTPLAITPVDEKASVELRLHVDLLACKSLCVPISADLSLDFDPQKVGATPLVDEALESIENEFEGVPLLWMLLTALLGGIILNFMPCVLPVLSIKMMGIIKHQNPQAAKKGFFFTALGILASFLALAGFTIVAREMGAAAGWGMHFQNPYFLNGMMVITLLFGKSLLGLFEIHLGSRTTTWLVTHEGKGHIKDFLTGAFATLLATPCSAPFVGSAVGFALARNTSDIILIFLVIGIGFALPYWIGLLLPTRFIKLPKPGGWMVILERVLGTALMATSLWLAALLTNHMSLGYVVLIYVFVSCVGLLYALEQKQKLPFSAHYFNIPLLLAAFVLPTFTRPALNPMETYKEASPVMDVWRPFDQTAISPLIKKGQVIVVDITADWCVTCALNKSTVLTHPKILEKLASDQIVAMRADWTHKSNDISTFLKTYNRYGIPFNVVFGPGAPRGIVLSEILNLDEILSAIEKAEKTNAARAQ